MKIKDLYRYISQKFNGADIDNAELEARFETELPVFQGRRGEYDPLDAMRRDAHREVFLVIRRRLALAERETTPINTNNNTTS